MRFIVLDTADSRGGVALFDNEVLLSREAHSGDEDFSIWLLPALHRIFCLASVSLSEIDGYAVCAGPGSFTGLRVGLTTAKAWSEIYRKPIVALSRLEALAFRHARSTPKFVASFFDARRNQVFAALYSRSDAGESLLGEEAVMPLIEFVARVRRETEEHPTHWVSPDAQLLTDLPEWAELASKHHVVDRITPPFFQQLGLLAFQKFQLGQIVDAVSLDANYVRRSDAESFWKDNPSAVKL